MSQKPQIKNPASNVGADTKKGSTLPEYEDKPGQSTQSGQNNPQSTDKPCCENTASGEANSK